MLTAGEFCNRQVVIARRGETLLDAARRMRDEHVGSVVVVDEGPHGPVPVGILTDRDIVVGVLARTDRHLHAVRVGETMTEDVIVARDDEPLADAMQRMRVSGIRRIPVVDRYGALQGIIAFDDLVEQLADEVNDLVTLLKREQRREATLRT